VFATGDPYDHVQALFGQLTHANLLTYIVEDGALIVNGQGNILQISEMPLALARFAMRWIQTAPEMAANFLIACGPGRAYTQLAADSDRFAASQAFYPGLTSVPDLQAIDDQLLKIDVTWLHADVTPQVTAFNRQFAGQLLATSSGLGGLNVTLPTVSKGAALSLLQQAWQVNSADMAAFGDSGNDLSMLQRVGQGIAMKNAAPEVRQLVANQTAQTNAQPAVLDQMAAWLG